MLATDHAATGLPTLYCERMLAMAKGGQKGDGAVARRGGGRVGGPWRAHRGRGLGGSGIIEIHQLQGEGLIPTRTFGRDETFDLNSSPGWRSISKKSSRLENERHTCPGAAPAPPRRGHEPSRPVTSRRRSRHGRHASQAG